MRISDFFSDPQGPPIESIQTVVMYDCCAIALFAARSSLIALHKYILRLFGIVRCILSGVIVVLAEGVIA